jgi:protein dithiol oxidoreductase (disulfide-forming)
MQRRQFTLAATASTMTLGLGISALGTAPSLAQMAKPQPGVDYLVLDKPAAVDAAAGKVEVIEFFGYWCPHCNAFEPELEAWLKRLPANISFRRVPVAFSEAQVPLQKMFYTLEALGHVNDMQRKVFTAIHAEKANLSTQESMVGWAVKQGIDQKKFVDAYTSFAVNTKASKAKQLANSYKIDGVPSLGVAGRFYTDGTLAKGMTRALQVVEQLAKEAKAA